MPTDNRIYLAVPFSAKSEAKALGAKWDPEHKSWWISDHLDTTPFQRWLPRAVGDLASCVTFPAQRILDLDELQDLLAYPALTAFFAPEHCWRCQKESWILGLYCHDVEDLDNSMAASLNAVLWPETIPELTAACVDLKIPTIGTLKNRFSNTTRSEYFSQGCAHCDALFGDFILHQQTWPTIWASRARSDYPFQAQLSWPVPSALDAAQTLADISSQCDTPGVTITPIHTDADARALTLHLMDERNNTFSYPATPKPIREHSH